MMPLENGNAPAGTEADPEHTAEQLQDETTAADSRFQVAYSRGHGEHDNTPGQRVVDSFAAFRDAIMADRATTKGQQWIAGPMGVAPDDLLHRTGGTDGSFARAIGKPHRCKACALPRRFIALDIDHALTPGAFAALVQVLQPLSGLVYTTASHTPAAPRCRVVLELDLPAPRAELIAATHVVQARIDAAMVAESQPAIPWDASCDKPEQPLYLPVVDSQTYTLDGLPLSLVELLAEVPASSESPKVAVQQPPAREADRYALAALVGAERAVLDAPEHTRNNVLNREAHSMGGFIGAGRLSHSVVTATLIDATERAGWATPEKNRATIQGGIASGIIKPRYEGLPGVPAQSPAANDAPPNNVRRLFTLTRADRIERKATDWLIRGYLVRDTLAALIAKPGACKSFLAVDWACRIATGTDWYGREVKPGAVFYFAGEGQRGLRKRIDGWEKHNGISTDGAPLYIASAMPFLCDPENVNSTLAILRETAQELHTVEGVMPTLIVVDTVARAMNGANENATDDMGKFIKACDALRHEWKCTVLAVHHTGNDPGAQDRGRGNSNFGASMDSDFYLKPKGDDLELRAGEKAKDWRKPSAVILSKVEVEVSSIGDDGEPVAETTLALHDAAGSIADTSKQDRVLELHQVGLTIRAIAEQTGVSRSTVQRWLKHAA